MNYVMSPHFLSSLGKNSNESDVLKIAQKIDQRAESVAKKLGIEANHARYLFRNAFDLSQLYGRSKDSYAIISDVLSSDGNAAKFVAGDWKSRQSEGNTNGGRGYEPDPRKSGMSTGKKIAIGVGVAAVGIGIAAAAVLGNTGSNLIPGPVVPTEEGGKAQVVYHISKDPKLIDVLRKHTDPNKDFLFEDTSANPGNPYSKVVINAFNSTATGHDYQFIIAGTSFDEVTTTKFTQAKKWGFNEKDVLLFDYENDPFDDIGKTLGAVKHEGYTPGVAVNVDTLMQQDENGVHFYEKVPLENMGLLNIQAQKYSGYAEKLYSDVKEIADYIKSKKSDVKVSVQLDFREASNCYDPNSNSIKPWDDPNNFGKTIGNENCVVDPEQSLQRLEKSEARVNDIPTVDIIMQTYLPSVPEDPRQDPTFACPTNICIPNDPKNLDRILTYVEHLPITKAPAVAPVQPSNTPANTQSNQTVSVKDGVGIKDQVAVNVTHVQPLGEINKAFTVYTISSSDDTLGIIKNHFPYPDTKNYIYQDTRIKKYVDPNNFSKEFPHIIAGTSYEEVTGTKFKQASEWGFDNRDVINYDIENWPNTPAGEQQDPAGSINKTMLAIKDKGYKAGITPGIDMIKEHYKDINWTNIDWVGLQWQRFSSDGDLIAREVTGISDYIKSVNPHTEVYVQVAFREANNCYDWHNNSVKPWNDPNNYGVTQGNEGCVVDPEKTTQTLEKTIRTVAEKVPAADGFIVTWMPADESDTPTFPQPANLTSEYLDRILDLFENVD